jgi:hypothetical protein
MGLALALVSQDHEPDLLDDLQILRNNVYLFRVVGGSRLSALHCNAIRCDDTWIDFALVKTRMRLHLLWCVHNR